MAETDRLKNTHPGEVLEKDFLEPLGISAYKLAKDIGVQQTRISQILRGERAITLDTASRLARYFGTSARIWLDLQLDYDLEELARSNSERHSDIKPYNYRA
jgi:addiction module antidote protein, HigA family